MPRCYYSALFRETVSINRIVRSYIFTLRRSYHEFMIHFDLEIIKNIYFANLTTVPA